MPEFELTQECERILGEVRHLTERLQILETRRAISTLPNSDLFNEKFLTRAFAVLGHDIVAGLLIVLPIYALMFILFAIKS